MEAILEYESILKTELQAELHGLAIHEGGHWLISELRGIVVDRVELAVSESDKASGTLIWKSLKGTTVEDQGVAIAAGFAAELIAFGGKEMAEKGFGCFRTDSKRLKQLGFTQEDTVRLINAASELIRQNTEKYNELVKKMEDAIKSKIIIGEKTHTFRG